MYSRQFIFLLIIAILAGGVFFSYRKKAEQESPYTPDPSSALGKELPLVISKHIEKNDSNPESAAKMNIPSVSLLSNRGAAEDINNYINRISDDVISRFFESRKRFASQSTSTGAGVVNTLSMNYETELLTPQILSFRLTITRSVTENPQPDIQTILIAFDCATGRTLEKDSFFGAVTDEELSSLFIAHYEGPTSTKPLPAEIINAIKSPHHLSVSPEHLELVIDDPKPSRILFVPLFYVTRYFKAHIKDALTSQTEMIRMSAPE